MIKYFCLMVLFSLVLENSASAFELVSSAFKNGEYIPGEYSCKGKDISPPLEWTGMPEGTRSFALICDDPDAPVGTWIHWVIFNLPAEKTGLEENLSGQNRLSDGALQGKNSWGKLGYGGPCPPPGKPHRYFFKLYALDTMLDLKSGATKQELLKAMEGHVLAEAELMGLFKR